MVQQLAKRFVTNTYKRAANMTQIRIAFTEMVHTP